MSTEKESDVLEKIIAETAVHETADVYRTLWGDARSLSQMPIVAGDDLFSGALARRRYRSARSLVKIVRGPSGVFLSEWAYEDIRGEPYGLLSKRPMVYFSDTQEAIEKSLWCYEQGMVTLIGEVHNAAIAHEMARIYRIDSLIADTRSLELLRPALQALSEPLASLSIVDTMFAPEELSWTLRYAREIRLVLALPETGVLASAPLTQKPLFAASAHTRIEVVEGRLVASKAIPLVTPIIRYDTGIRAGDLSFAE